MCVCVCVWGGGGGGIDGCQVRERFQALPNLGMRMLRNMGYKC